MLRIVGEGLVNLGPATGLSFNWTGWGCRCLSGWEIGVIASVIGSVDKRFSGGFNVEEFYSSLRMLIHNVVIHQHVHTWRYVSGFKAEMNFAGAHSQRPQSRLIAVETKARQSL
ncbi:hypothetical protein WN48_03940 [Eufriesea mexicana]|nr:hypothetical protein WN48_03940 [Eufriesea mexicana]